MKVKFLIAEEVRRETEGKVTVLGLFSGDTILLVRRDQPKYLPEQVQVLEAIERLAILVTIGDAPAGIHKFKGKMIDPLGGVHHPEMPLGEAQIPKNFFHTIIVEIKPFITKIRGVYRFEFYVDEELSTFLFEIRDQNLVAS